MKERRRCAMSNSYSEELRELSEAAEGGDCDAGERLLALFASLADDSHDPHPELVRHMARCVRRYVNLEARERRDGAQKAFCVHRPRSRPISVETNARHVMALVEFYVARIQNVSFEEAKARGAEAGKISDDCMHDLTRTKKKTRQAWAEEFSATLHLTKEQRAALVGDK